MSQSRKYTTLNYGNHKNSINYLNYKSQHHQLSLLKYSSNINNHILSYKSSFHTLSYNHFITPIYPLSYFMHHSSTFKFLLFPNIQRRKIQDSIKLNKIYEFTYLDKVKKSIQHWSLSFQIVLEILQSIQISIYNQISSLIMPKS